MTIITSTAMIIFSQQKKIKKIKWHPSCVVQVVAQHGESVRMSAVRQDVQALVHTVHPSADPLGHATLSVPVLRQTVPPEVRHEEAHLHTHG